MNHRFPLAVAVVAAALVFIGCSGSAPAAPTQPPSKPTEPTKAPAAPTQAAAPTKAPEPTKAAQPTTAPTAAPTAPPKKVDFPQKGKTITIIVPFDAGGPTDLQARLTAQLMEKDLGGPVEVLNKPGASGQIGTAELAKAKPDGYTLALIAMPTTIQVYLDTQRKVGYGRKDFQPIANQVSDPGVVAVAAASPFKDMKDLMDATKANPEKVKMATVGAMTIAHLWAVMLEKMGNVRFALVHFSGSAPATTALLGSHVDALAQAGGTQASLVKSGQTRVLGVMDRQESPFFPGVKTMEAQGYKLFAASSRGYSAPAGTPKEIVDVLNASIRRISQTEEYKRKMEEQGQTLHFLDAAAYGAYWDEVEAQTKPMMELLVTK